MIDLINAAFENYYGILIAVLIVMVPIWFAGFIVQAAAAVLHRHRKR